MEDGGEYEGSGLQLRFTIDGDPTTLGSWVTRGDAEWGIDFVFQRVDAALLLPLRVSLVRSLDQFYLLWLWRLPRGFRELGDVGGSDGAFGPLMSIRKT